MPDKLHIESAVIERYLLGEMSEEEQAGFEDSYFTNSELLHQVQEHRNDLVDAYVRNELDARQRELFECRLLKSPNLRESVEFAREFQYRSDTRQGASSPMSPVVAPGWVRSYVPMAAILLVGLVAAILLVKNRDHRGDEPQRITDTTTPDAASSPAASSVPRAPVTSTSPLRANIALIVLRGDLTRSGNSGHEFKIAPGVRDVVIQAEVDAQEWSRSGNHEVTISTPEGRNVWNAGGSAIRFLRETELIEVTLPAVSLVPGDYVLRLVGTGDPGVTSDLGSFYFSVVRP